MLSTENPPPDLCEISQLKSGDGGSDESNKQQLEVDLAKSGLDYNNPLPKFSIRDYVFNTRGKDIKNNWPFSQKNLQVCLKHGVKDVLPPFHSLDSVKNPSIEELVVGDLRYSDDQYPKLSDGSVYGRPAVNIEDINSSECEEDKEFPSSTTSQSCSDTKSVHPISNSCLEPEAQYLPSELPEFAVRERKKAEGNTQSPAKKCRLILKVHNIAEPKPAEDSAVNTPVVSGTMTSKVCPVCKIFSSSSNTTLNAHIDQCLSGESVKWATNSKVIKHRIKPRKTRLMVDIYETALRSTLEDLDKRNGTNWASNMGLQSQDLEGCAEERKKIYSADNTENINKEGAVYIDSSGTKLRILSKLDCLPSKSNIKDTGSCKIVRRDKVIQLLSSKKKKKKKKKKHTLQKFEPQKKSSLDGQGSCSSIRDLLPDYPLHGSKSCYPKAKVNYGQHKLYPPEVHKDIASTKSPITSDHMKSDDFGVIKPWADSTYTGLKKKNDLERENLLPDKILKNFKVKSASSLGDSGNSGRTSSTSSDENHMLPPEGFKRKENFSRTSDGWTKLPCQRKEPRLSLLRSKHLSEKKNQLMSSESNVMMQLRKGSISVHEHLMDPPNIPENLASSRSNKKMGISSGLAAKNDSSFIGSSIAHHHTFSSEGKKATPLKKLYLGHAISSEGRKFSSLRSKLLSGRRASGAKSQKKSERELSNSKNPRPHYTLRSDEDNLVQPLGEDTTLMKNGSGQLLTERTRVSKIHKKMRGSAKSGQGDLTSNGSETSTEWDSFNAGNKIDYFTGRSVPVEASVLEEEAKMLDDFVCEPESIEGEGFASFSKSLDSAFPGLVGSDVECVSLYYNKEYDGHCPTELIFHADQEMFSAVNAGKNVVTSDCHEMAEMDGNEARGNYFVDVDPIPIPGPPGSFLPSPGRMGSEELLQHSHLTNCRIQSSDDGHDVVDMDSSDSQVSEMSTVSNSVAGRSSSISTANLSAQSHFKHESQLDITNKRNNPVVEDSPSFEQIDSGDREFNLLKSKANLMLPDVTRDVQNIQPCCCSRKDVSLQGDSLGYQESQILSRRAGNSLSVLAMEMQVNDDTDNGIGCYDLSEAAKELSPLARKAHANSPNGYTHVPIHNSEEKFQACGDFAFPSPSTSNPVLRLMGKDLVVNKDDNVSPITRPSMIEHPAVRLYVENGHSARNSPNEPNSFHHNILSRGPSMQTSIPAQQFDFNSSDAFKIPTSYRPSSQLSSHPATASFSGLRFGDNATSLSGCHEYAGGLSLTTDQLGSKIRPDSRRAAYDTEKGSTVHNLRTIDSSAGKHKEIIIIDDSPESEAGLAEHCSTKMDSRESVGTAASMSLPPDSRHANPFYSYEVQFNPRFAGSPGVPPSTANFSKWNCIQEDSSALRSSSSSSSLPSSVHLRFSSGFS